MEPSAYEDLALLARVCAERSHFSKNPTAAQLWRLALDYQRRAAALDLGRLPDIGLPPPAWFNERPPRIRRRDGLRPRLQARL